MPKIYRTTFQIYHYWTELVAEPQQQQQQKPTNKVLTMFTGAAEWVVVNYRNMIAFLSSSSSSSFVSLYLKF